MWNISFHCSPPNQQLCVAKTKPRFMNMVSITVKHVLWAYCFYSVLNIFRVLNTNHKLNDLTSKATTLKGLHLISIPHSAARCEKQLCWIKISVFLHVSTFRRFPWFFMSCVQTSAGERMDCRRAELDHYAWNDISLKVSKTFLRLLRPFMYFL